MDRDAPDDCGYPCLRPAIFGQRRDRDGGALGDPFIIGQAGEYGPVGHARVAVAPAGNFLVTYSTTLRAVGTQPVIVAYAADGSLVYHGIPSDDASRASATGDVVALDNNAFVVWYKDVSNVLTPDFDLAARIVDADGTPVTDEFRVNGEATGSQWWPRVDAAEDGSFAVSWAQWEARTQLSRRGALLLTGAATSAEFRVDTYPSASKDYPSLGVGNDGAFMVAWESAYQDGSYRSIFGQLHASDDTRVGTEFAVNTYTPERDSGPAVASLSDGAFVVAWERYTQEGTDGRINRGIFARSFAASGSLRDRSFASISAMEAATSASTAIPSAASSSYGRTAPFAGSASHVIHVVPMPTETAARPQATPWSYCTEPWARLDVSSACVTRITREPRRQPMRFVCFVRRLDKVRRIARRAGNDPASKPLGLDRVCARAGSAKTRGRARLLPRPF